MTWAQAHNLIIQNITQGLKLDKNSRFRIVSQVPPYKCSAKNYNSNEGFKIQIGQKTFIDIPITMLQTIFNDAALNNGIYNKNVFRIHYPTQAEKNGHPCHVHVVGKIFEIAGIATMEDKNNYRLIH
jgi:hypothetical protein